MEYIPGPDENHMAPMTLKKIKLSGFEAFFIRLEANSNTVHFMVSPDIVKPKKVIYWANRTENT